MAKTLKLSAEESRETGFTHKAVITHNDLTAAATTETVSLVTGLGVGHLIKEAAFRLVSGFVGASVTNLTMEVGYDLAAGSDDPNGIIEAVELGTAGTEILAGDATGAIFATKRTGFAPQEGCTITALFTATGANVSVLTAGEVHVYLSVVDLTSL
jgi:hypothetical protein